MPKVTSILGTLGFLLFTACGVEDGPTSSWGDDVAVEDDDVSNDDTTDTDTNNDDPTADADGDGYLASVDCDDTDPDIHDNCPEDPTADADGDGYTAAVDCDDTDPDIHDECNSLSDDPSMTDDDQDGVMADVDCDDQDPMVGDCSADVDGDGYDAGTGSNDDCNDGDPNINPGQLELCDGIDNNCKNGIDEGCPTGGGSTSVDNDGDGDPASTDCNDNNPAIYNGAVDHCGDSIDQDCDGQDLACTTDDSDGDSYDSLASGGTDCDDTKDTVHPNATEVCNGIDDNCVGGIDEGCLPPDGDNDGFDSIADGGTDCDDTDDQVHENAAEVCDGIDNDCNGSIDAAAVDIKTWYKDDDGDDYGDDGSSMESCNQPSGYVLNDNDCDDDDDQVSPRETEVCDDGIDNNCDGGDESCSGSGAPVRHDFRVRAKVAPLASEGVTSTTWFGTNISTGYSAYWFQNMQDAIIKAPSVNYGWSHYDSIPLYAMSGESWGFQGICTGAGSGAGANMCIDNNGNVLGDSTVALSDLFEITGDQPNSCSIEWDSYDLLDNPWSFLVVCTW